jgi:hypothetical protein
MSVVVLHHIYGEVNVNAPHLLHLEECRVAGTGVYDLRFISNGKRALRVLNRMVGRS